MKRNQLSKVCQALGFKTSSNPATVGFSTNVRSDRSSMVRPEPNAEDAKYASWLVDHPSALMSLEEMMRVSKGKKIVVFLDYDGTLSQIVDDPELAFMSDNMRLAVKEDASQFPTAIRSGRSRNKLGYKNAYTREEMNEVQQIWATYIMDNHLLLYQFILYD